MSRPADPGPAPGLVTRRGHVFENPLTRERAVLIGDPAVRPDRGLVAHLYVGVGGRVSAPHVHPVSTERFRVVRGQVGFVVGGVERVLGPGEQTAVPPGVVHDWWQVGADPAEVVVDMTPGDRFVEMLSTIFGLVRDGQVDRRGTPHLLQLAVTARAYRDAMVFAAPPPWVQRLVFGALAPVGRALGRRPAYDRYRTSAEIVEPDAAVLALLDGQGRLRAAD